MTIERPSRALNFGFLRVVACTVVLFLVTCSLPAQQTSAAAEQRLFLATNIARQNEGLPVLKWDPALAEAARSHAQWLIANPELSHQYSGEPDLASRAAQAGAHFSTVAENIAMGPSANSIHDHWMQSPPHRRNILDPSLTAAGFAVVQQSGYLYAVADFDRSVAALTAAQVERSVGELLLAHGVQPTAPSLDARQTCEMSHGSAGGTNPTFVMRWQSSDLSQLPPVLVDRIRTAGSRSAAVGACASAGAERGFTSYRIAVLLY